MLMAAELKQTPVISEELKNWVSTAASSGATDMHIEPYGEGLRVRLRVGGALVQPPFQSEAPEGAVDQLKAMAGLPLGKSLAPTQASSLSISKKAKWSRCGLPRFRHSVATGFFFVLPP